MNFRRFNENFRRSRPNHHQSITAFFFFKFGNIGNQLLGKFHFVLARFDVFARDALDVILLENCRHRLQRFELFAQIFDLRFLQNASIKRRFVSRIGKNIPRAEHDIVQIRNRHKIFNFRTIDYQFVCPNESVPICVSEPIGCAIPLRIASTPATKVVLTAPSPTSKIPSLPVAGAISTPFSTINLSPLSKEK